MGCSEGQFHCVFSSILMVLVLHGEVELSNYYQTFSVILVQSKCAISVIITDNVNVSKDYGDFYLQLKGPEK